MGLIAERAAGRMQARQTYRTMARMERRRSFVQDKMGMRQDFGRQEQPAETAAPTSQGAPEPEYVGSSNGSHSLGIRASSATTTSKPRRNRYSGSEKRVRRRR